MLNFTDEQIIQAMVCCDTDQKDCDDCPLRENSRCVVLKNKRTLELVNRLKADNLQLNSDLIILKNDYEHLKQNFDETVEKKW